MKISTLIQELHKIFLEEGDLYVRDLYGDRMQAIALRKQDDDGPKCVILSDSAEALDSTDFITYDDELN